MAKVLYLSASPRGEQSASIQTADVFLKALSGDVEVNHIDLFNRTLPDVTAEVTAAKFKAFLGMELEAEEALQWQVITDLVAEFLDADHYLMAIPMWNFGPPYKIKQYIDLINHPGMTFTRDENGPRGLASGSATLIYSRGGDYSPRDGQPDPLDFQSTYMRAWLGTVGITNVEEILVQNTMAGPDALKTTIDGVTERLTAIATSIS
ncbi:MAG: NAD(P)H-dependent oxidoreductase [Gammaproteobacteria bacterium]